MVRFRFWLRCLLLERGVLMEVSIQMAVWWQVNSAAASVKTVTTMLRFNTILKIAAAGCCETLAAIYHTTRNYLQKDCNIT